jgi:RHS repeat-associated protein
MGRYTNSKSAELDEGVQWQDVALRNYDAEIGRFVQADPYEEYPSPYTGMGNDPVNLIDPSGGGVFDGLTTAGRLVVTTLGGAIIGEAAGLLSGDDGFKGAAIGAGVGLLGGVSSISLRLTAVLGINTANSLAQGMKSSMSTQMVGPQIDGRLPSGPNTGMDDSDLFLEDGDPVATTVQFIEDFWHDGVVPGMRLINTYINPLTPLVELATGRSVESDFTQKKSRVHSGAEATLMMVPFGKIEATAAKVLEKNLAEKTAIKIEEKIAASSGTSLIKTGIQFSKHSLERLAQRGVTKDMAELAISKGQKFYDPLNKSINYVLANAFGSVKVYWLVQTY